MKNAEGEVTPSIRCNNCCIMCPGIMPPPEKAKDAGTEEMMGYIDSLGDPGIISFTGGEPTVNKELPRILRHARDRHPSAEIVLLTNGRLFSYPGYSEEMSKLGISKIITEIHGSSAGKHDAITRAPGSFEQTMSGIRNLVERGMNLEIRIVAHKMNYTDIPDIAKLLSGVKGIGRAVIFPIDIRGNAYMNRENVMISNREILPYVENAVDLLTAKGIGVKLFHLPLCILKPSYRKFSAGVTAPPIRIYFGEECEGCECRGECPGLWKTYVKHFGAGEIKAIGGRR